MNSMLLASTWGKKVGKKLLQGPRFPKPTFETHRWNIVRGDQVEVISGPEKGNQGKVLAVLRKDNRVIIEGVNLVSFITYILCIIFFSLFSLFSFYLINISNFFLPF